MAKAIDKLISTTKLKIRFGTFHCTNKGACSDFELIADVVHSLNLYNKIYPIQYIQNQYKPDLPINTVLDSTDTPGIIIHWADALHNYFKQKGYIAQEY